MSLVINLDLMALIITCVAVAVQRGASRSWLQGCYICYMNETSKSVAASFDVDVMMGAARRVKGVSSLAAESCRRAVSLSGYKSVSVTGAVLQRVDDDVAIVTLYVSGRSRSDIAEAALIAADKPFSTGYSARRSAARLVNLRFD